MTTASVSPGGRLPVNERRGSLYRGGQGMWSWVAHRITGVLVFFFLFTHVLDTALVRVSPETYNQIIETYKNPLNEEGTPIENCTTGNRPTPSRTM